MHSPFQLAAANVIFTGRESPYLQRVKCPRTTDAPFARSSSAVAHTTAISYSSCTCERARLNARGNYGGPAERRASVRCGSGCVNLRTSSRNLTRPCETSTWPRRASSSGSVSCQGVRDHLQSSFSSPAFPAS